MRRVAFALVLGALGAIAAPATASDDPIAARQALMSSVGAAGAAGGGMLQGEIAYSPVIGRAAIAALNASAQTFGDFFPDDSRDAARSDATAAVWEDRAGFEARLARFQEAAAAAVEASGRQGPADIDAFRAAFQPVLGTCRDCHETYRTPQN